MNEEVREYLTAEAPPEAIEVMPPGVAFSMSPWAAVGVIAFTVVILAWSIHRLRS